MTTFRTNRRHAVQFASTAAMVAWLRSPLNALADDGDNGDSPTSDESDVGKPLDSGPLPYLDRIGLQLYTLRNQMADDPTKTLQAVADAGYAQVELMSINNDSVGLAAIARDKGLKVHSAFMDFNAITDPKRDGVTSVEATLELAERIGLRHVVFGYIGRKQRDTADKCKAIADRANVAAEATRAAGMRMCYHNHAFEFAKFKGSSRTAFDIFIERFDPRTLEFELDVFWAKIGGRDPIEMMRRLAGRISQVHLKDLKDGVPTLNDESKVPKDAFQELGDGIIDMPEVMRVAHQIGVDQCHVEQDQSPSPLDSIRRSAEFLRLS